MFATPIAVKLQDGIEAVEPEKNTLVDKMAALYVRLMPSGSYNQKLGLNKQKPEHTQYKAETQ